MGSCPNIKQKILVWLHKTRVKWLREDSVLLDPHGELSKVLSTSAIEEANKEKKDVLVREKAAEDCYALMFTCEIHKSFYFRNPQKFL